MSKGKVLLSKETASKWSPKNLHARENVNVSQGPRVGTEGAHSTKRAAFHAAKEERAPLATVIENAYAKRQHEYAEHEYTNGGSIHDNTYEKTRKHGARVGRDLGKTSGRK